MSRKRRRRRRRPKAEARYIVAPGSEPVPAPASLAGVEPDASSEELFWFVIRRAVGRLLCVPMTPAEVAVALGIARADARMWLARLESEGTLIRTGSKRRSFLARQTNLFAGAAPERRLDASATRALADRVHAAFRFLTNELAWNPVGPTEVAAELGVTKRYAGQRLRLLVKEGRLTSARGLDGQV